MDVTIFIFLMLCFLIIRGAVAYFLKTGQDGFIISFSDSILFTVIFAFFQFVLLLPIPPYEFSISSVNILIYPFLYAALFIITYLLYFKALDCGPVGLTNTLFSFNIVLPIIINIILGYSSVNLPQTFGLVLFFISILIFHFSSYDKSKDKQKRFNTKWLLLSLMSVITGGILVIITTQAMKVYTDSKLYLVLLNFFIIILGLPVIIKNINRVKALLTVRKFTLSALGAAFIQNLNNIIFIYYIVKVESTLFLPLISVLGIVGSVLIGFIAFKEKLTVQTAAAILISAASIYLLNL